MNAYPPAARLLQLAQGQRPALRLYLQLSLQKQRRPIHTNLLAPYVTEYKAEPWHIRYVGPDLAQQIYAAHDPDGRNYLDPLSPLVPQQFLLPQ